MQMLIPDAGSRQLNGEALGFCLIGDLMFWAVSYEALETYGICVLVVNQKY